MVDLKVKLEDMRGECVKMQHRILNLLLPHVRHNAQAVAALDDVIDELGAAVYHLDTALDALGWGDGTD